MKKFLLTILLLSIFFALAGFAQAATTIVKDYPELPGTDKPGEAKKGEELPQFIKYLFMFSLSIVGIIGLAAIIIGAFGYLTAVGNPQQAAKAKEQIFSALLGILLLLGSYLLLSIINPDLLSLGVKLKKVQVNPGGNGGTECQGNTSSWTPSSINERGSSTYYIDLSNACRDVPQGSLSVGWRVHLWQENVAERQSRRCGNPTRNMIENRIEVVCQFENVTDGLKNNPERFYMEGSIEINKRKMNVSKNTNSLLVRD